MIGPALLGQALFALQYYKLLFVWQLTLPNAE